MNDNTLLTKYYDDSRTKEKTRNSIISVIANILEKVSIFNINVKMVCDEIEITRQQFYRYYDSLESAIFDTVAVVIDNVTISMMSALEKVKTCPEDEQIRMCFLHMRSEETIRSSRIIDQFDIFSDTATEENKRRFHIMHSITNNTMNNVFQIYREGINKGILKEPEIGIKKQLNLAFFSYHALVSKFSNHSIVELNFDKDELLDIFLDDIMKNFINE